MKTSAAIFALSICAATIFGLGACATGSGGASGYQFGDVTREVNARGISFGVTPLVKEGGAKLSVRFKFASADGAEPELTEAAWAEAAAKAAPAGCTVASMIPNAEGGRDVKFSCPK